MIDNSHYIIAVIKSLEECVRFLVHHNVYRNVRYNHCQVLAAHTVPRSFRMLVIKVKCTGPGAGSTPRNRTVQSPEVEPIRTEMRGTSGQQPPASRGASLKRPPPHHRDGVMLGGLTLVKYGFSVLRTHEKWSRGCWVRGKGSPALLRRDRDAQGEGPPSTGGTSRSHRHTGTCWTPFTSPPIDRVSRRGTSTGGGT